MVLSWNAQRREMSWVCFWRKGENKSVGSTVFIVQFSLSKTILQGTLEGERRRGRQRKCWIDNIKEWTSSVHTQIAHKGLQQRRLEEDLCWIVPHAPPPRPNRSRDWTELNYGDWWARMLTNNGYSPYCRNLRRKMVTVVSPEMGSCRSEEERPCFAWAKRGEFPRPWQWPHYWLCQGGSPDSQGQGVRGAPPLCEARVYVYVRGEEVVVVVVCRWWWLWWF